MCFQRILKISFALHAKNGLAIYFLDRNVAKNHSRGCDLGVSSTAVTHRQKLFCCSSSHKVARFHESEGYSPYSMDTIHASGFLEPAADVGDAPTWADSGSFSNDCYR